MNLESLIAESVLNRMRRADTPEAMMELVLVATGDKELACRKAAEVMEVQAMRKAGAR